MKQRPATWAWCSWKSRTDLTVCIVREPSEDPLCAWISQFFAPKPSRPWIVSTRLEAPRMCVGGCGQQRDPGGGCTPRPGCPHSLCFSIVSDFCFTRSKHRWDFRNWEKGFFSLYMLENKAERSTGLSLLRAPGISGKSQVLFALVFTTRYLDLFTNFISIYNTVMKVVFLLCAYVTVYMIYGKFRKTFDSENDTFRLEFLLVPVIGLSFLENYSFTPLEILWTFSIYLESVAILPQLFMISKTGEAETITTHYLFFLGLYRALYLANWIRRYQTENFYDQIAVVSGVVQTIFYCDFFYLYVTKVLKGKKLSLPMPI